MKFFVNIFLILVFLIVTGRKTTAEPKEKTDRIQSKVSDSERKDKSKINTKSKSKDNKPGSLVLKNKKGLWKPMELIWEESSGAVSPEFRFAKQFQLVTKENKVILNRRVVEKGKLVLNESKEISPQLYQKWMESLFHYKIYQLPLEDVPKEQMTGVSYNYVSFGFGSTKSKFYYQLEERNLPDWKEKNSIIQIIERMKP
ncbi:permease [Leptospira mtsangambouensis]|uniref:permease n=1 Tax=Leptospira mtsangambouensis TaxID=2484912 RepID=UPI001EE9CF59|nr:permease [Leptospira mtsangambouensis]MCG6140299.1 permease [Leptospira mtsangambouensis]